jgi:hypothetical protein
LPNLVFSTRTGNRPMLGIMSCQSEDVKSYRRAPNPLTSTVSRVPDTPQFWCSVISSRHWPPSAMEVAAESKPLQRTPPTSCARRTCASSQ